MSLWAGEKDPFKIKSKVTLRESGEKATFYYTKIWAFCSAEDTIKSMVRQASMEMGHR